MNVEIRNQWADALESGEYQQGKNMLTRVDGYGNEKNCCLGVLCDLAVKAGVIHRTKVDGGTVYYGVNSDEEAASYPPQSVIEWAGLPACNPAFVVDGEPNDAGNLNDRSNNFTFPEIAHLVRTQL